MPTNPNRPICYREVLKTEGERDRRSDFRGVRRKRDADDAVVLVGGDAVVLVGGDAVDVTVVRDGSEETADALSRTGRDRGFSFGDGRRGDRGVLDI
ncbi:hypothetical protein [Halorubrum saccharovorum]|uniref:hypothetical protein n=1 Tax=Halorubrum saccharovorum TaxID=2248 RepID=UPI000B24D16F|nr:hypothetical protein [Halorubrum saccharovorum]